MCLEINYEHNKNGKAKIAEKDIYVIKVFGKCDPTIRALITPYQYSHYLMNELYKSKMKRNSWDEDSINEGLHAYNKFAFHILVQAKPIITIAVIPKGSKYYIGCSRDIVSNQLKIVDIIYIKDKPDYLNMLSAKFINEKDWNFTDLPADAIFSNYANVSEQNLYELKVYLQKTYKKEFHCYCNYIANILTIFSNTVIYTASLEY